MVRRGWRVFGDDGITYKLRSYDDIRLNGAAARFITLWSGMQAILPLRTTIGAKKRGRSLDILSICRALSDLRRRPICDLESNRLVGTQKIWRA